MSDLLVILDQLDEARAKATPGPWQRGDNFDFAVWNGRTSAAIAASPADAACIVAEHNAAPKLTAALRAVAERAEIEVEDAEAGARYAAEVDQTVLLRSEEARAYAWRTVQSLLTAALTPEATS